LCDTLWYPRTISVKNRPDPRTPREQYTRAIMLLTELFHHDLMLRQQGLPSEPLIMAPGPFARKAAKK